MATPANNFFSHISDAISVHPNSSSLRKSVWPVSKPTEYRERLVHRQQLVQPLWHARMAFFRRLHWNHSLDRLCRSQYGCCRLVRPMSTILRKSRKSNQPKIVWRKLHSAMSAHHTESESPVSRSVGGGGRTFNHITVTRLLLTFLIAGDWVLDIVCIGVLRCWIVVCVDGNGWCNSCNRRCGQ